jgi:hypothetical protein
MRTMLLFKPCTVRRLFQSDRALDYRFGEDGSVEYARKALALGRLDVVYALLIASYTNGAASTRIAGRRFSQDVAIGGSLFATLAAKGIVVTHLRVVAFAPDTAGLSAAQRDATKGHWATRPPWARLAISAETGLGKP